MENKVIVRVYSDYKHFELIEVNESEVESVKEINRLLWKQLKQEERKRIRLEKEGISIVSFESLDEEGCWIDDESSNIENNIIMQESKQEICQLIQSAIKNLNPRQQEMIRMVFYENKSQDCVAEKFGISKSAISHSFERIYASLKRNIKKNQLFLIRPSTDTSKASFKGEGVNNLNKI